jgi:hypothetical protein
MGLVERARLTNLEITEAYCGRQANMKAVAEAATQKALRVVAEWLETDEEASLHGEVLQRFRAALESLEDAPGSGHGGAGEVRVEARSETACYGGNLI